MTQTKPRSETEVRDEMAIKHASHIVAVGDPENGYEQDFEFSEEQAEDFKAGWSAALKHSPTVLALVEALQGYREADGLPDSPADIVLKAYEESVRRGLSD